MNISNPMSFYGNCIAFFILAIKTFYDLWWNPHKFKKDLQIMDTLEAARKKRERADKLTATTFAILAISYGILILEAVI